MEAYISLRQVSRRYKNKDRSVTAVDRLSLDIERGEFMTLLGPSGCGKTTLLRILAGFEKPDEGEILQEGMSLEGIPPYKRNMPMVFQNYALFPHMTVFENIAYGLKAAGKSRDVIRNDVAVACQAVNLMGLEDRYPGELSGGQQQRAALARALVMKSRIILFDEPLSHLDEKLRSQTRREIKRLQKMLNLTVLYVTHDQAEALSLSDRIAVMNKGRILQTGTPEEIYRNPGEPFIADFIGSANFLEARIEEIEGTRMTLKLQDRLLVVNKRKNESFSEGEEVYLAVRPEALSLSDDPTDFKAVLDLRSFMGSTVEYKLEFEGTFITITEESSRDEKPETGQILFFRINREDLRIYRK